MTRRHNHTLQGRRTPLKHDLIGRSSLDSKIRARVSNTPAKRSVGLLVGKLDLYRITGSTARITRRPICLTLPLRPYNYLVASLQSITENLARAEKEFFAAADAVPAAQWKTSPGEGHWSAGELVCHLIMVERAIIKNARKLLQRPPKPRPLSKRFHLPMALVEFRLVRRKTPIPLDPSLVCEKDEMLVQLREVRGRTLVFMQEAAGKDSRKYHMNPILFFLEPSTCWNGSK